MNQESRIKNGDLGNGFIPLEVSPDAASGLPTRLRRVGLLTGFTPPLHDFRNGQQGSINPKSFYCWTKSISARAGFTLLEVLMAVGVMAIIGALTVASFASSRRVRDLAVSGPNVLSVLRIAAERAAAGQDGSTWGVRLEGARFILFRGASYAGSADTTIYNLPASVQIINVALAGGGQEIVFHRLDGRTDQAGAFDMQVIGSASQIFSVTIDPSGRAYQTGTASAVSGTRVIDARHRNFILGWTIKDATTMRLTWSNPPAADVISDIAMAPASPRAAYDWSGTTAVGGQNQKLRIHALAITDTNTTLSVDRDCRYNNKKLTIAIDTKTIATYEADCASVAVGAFGGVMSEP